jgi:N-acetyltransferase 10
MAQRGLLDPEKEDPFALFVASTNIRRARGAASPEP